MKAHATIQINLKSIANIKGLFQALKPETKVPETSKSKVKINVEGKNLMLKFETVDSTSLRASISSYLRWIQAIQYVYNIVEVLK